MTVGRPTILAIASGGGHWHQLLRLVPALPLERTVFASPLGPEEVPAQVPKYHQISDGNRDTKVKLGLVLMQLLWLLVRYRPAVIITTGAAPGCLALLLGRWFGAKGLFIDSVANARELSLSARLARDRGLTVYSQWPDVAAREGV
ncbi:MAG: UDP-N-acetylglucosamine--LPS N-acetylglucosamine transferase, partial [Pseudomonadota bacterium]